MRIFIFMLALVFCQLCAPVAFGGASDTGAGGGTEQIRMEADRYETECAELIGQERLPEAEAVIKKAIELDPRNPDYHYMHAEVLYLQNRLEAAQRAVERAEALGGVVVREPGQVEVEETGTGSFSESEWLGAILLPISPQLAPAFGSDTAGGAFVLHVPPNSAAATLGLQGNDVIVKLNDRKLSNMTELMDAQADALSGSALTLEVLRNNTPQILSMNTAIPPPAPTPPATPTPPTPPRTVTEKPPPSTPQPKKTEKPIPPVNF